MSKATLLAGAFLCVNFFAFSQTEAITVNGDHVLLYDDGTWRSAEELIIDKDVYVMPTPAFNGQLAEDLLKVGNKLSLVSSKPNDITDTENWFQENGLDLPTYTVPNSFRNEKGNLPDGVPTSYNGMRIIQAIYADDYNFFVYGNYFSEGRILVIMDGELKHVLHVLDFKNYTMSPAYIEEDKSFIFQGINWVQIENNVLYVSHAHHTYAESSKGMNAYITAIDLNTYEIIWRTKPLVCNTSNFIVYGDVIVCGYGFTAEKDYVYTLNKRTGAVVQKVLVKTGPDYIVRKENKLYIRTYDTDYIFKMD